MKNNITEQNSANSIEETKYINFTPKGILKCLLSIIFLLLVAHITGVVCARFGIENLFSFYLIKFFNFEGEYNITAYFSSLLLLTSGLLSLLISILGSGSKRKYSFQWKVLGVIFVFLALDESIRIHEMVSKAVKPRLGDYDSDFLFAAWVLPYLIFVLLVGIYFFRFVLKLPAKTRNLFFISGFVYVSAALGLEVIENPILANQGHNLAYTILVVIEELFEMLGITIFIFALMDYLALSKARISIITK